MEPDFPLFLPCYSVIVEEICIVVTPVPAHVMSCLCLYVSSVSSVLTGSIIMLMTCYFLPGMMALTYFVPMGCVAMESIVIFYGIANIDIFKAI